MAWVATVLLDVSASSKTNRRHTDSAVKDPVGRLHRAKENRCEPCSEMDAISGQWTVPIKS